jgi:hypothetical protein
MLKLDFLPIEKWDLMSIIYSLVASVIFFLALKWFGVLRRLKNYFKNKKATGNYLKSIKNDCNSLIVIGKRKGFLLNDVYVTLDLALSDLMPKENKEREFETPQSYVLLGGPGAGKSTTAKNRILEHLENKYLKNLPFFVSLKDYNGNISLFQFLVAKFETYNFADSSEFVKNNLSNQNSLCILDGLDEVRPHLREKVCNEINTFYKNYFKNCGSLIVTCRKEAYRDIPLDINTLLEVRPLSDEQIKRFADKWPIEYPRNKTADTFLRDLMLSPKILEIARSPLLLVGGLMHYTEANLGIPEERFEYLQTMAKWLVVDWATAQGHAPDIYRNVYDRLLTSLAFNMHSNNRSDIPFDEAKTFVSNLLPLFGYRIDESETILNNITIRTGILLKDGNNLFFAQFGLQEYFTSKELMNNKIGKEIADLSPITWWREPILLFIAQQKDPTELLTAIIKKDPILAVAAIAECPTPSLAIQNEAVQICLNSIDKKNKAIQGSITPFLRKVKDSVEIKLISELEKRLTNDEEISSIVGISLAAAGTNSATNLLAKHPEIWHICLKEAGYLSSNFENLLVSWIQEGDDFNSIKAADLLSKRITSDRLYQLLEIIPTLSKKKKEHLSRLLLKELINNSDPRFSHVYNDLPVISKLVPNISNPKTFIQELTDFTKNRPYRFYPSYESNAMPAIILSFFFKRKGIRCTTAEIIEYFTNAIIWQKNKKSILFWMFSVSSFIISNLEPTVYRLSIFFILTLLFFQSYSMSLSYSRFLNYRRISTFRSKIINPYLFYLLGCLGFIMIGDYFNLINIKDGSKICILGSSILFSIFGFLSWEISSLSILLNSRTKKDSIITVGFRFPVNFNFIFLTVTPICVWISGIYLIWLIFHFIRFTYYFSKVNKAESQADSELDVNLNIRYFR